MALCGLSSTARHSGDPGVETEKGVSWLDRDSNPCYISCDFADWCRLPTMVRHAQKPTQSQCREMAMVLFMQDYSLH